MISLSDFTRLNLGPYKQIYIKVVVFKIRTVGCKQEMVEAREIEGVEEEASKEVVLGLMAIDLSVSSAGNLVILCGNATTGSIKIFLTLKELHLTSLLLLLSPFTILVPQTQP